jgi:hypothetical protein
MSDGTDRAAGWRGAAPRARRALRPRRADEHFAPEAAARDAGHDVALIDHDALAEPDEAERAADRVPDGGGAAPAYSLVYA